MIRGNKILIFILILLLQPVLVSFAPQEARVNQKKIERDRAKKQKQARKDYDQAVRHHNKIQSKSTKASMKKTKKESKRSTPTKR